MTATEPCIHELAPASCSVCSGRDREPAERSGGGSTGPVFTARYPGRCSCCGEDFAAGDQIRADGDSGYCCDDCAGDDFGEPA